MTKPDSNERTVPTDPNVVCQSEIAKPRFPKIIEFNDLCRCGEEVWIENAGQIYRLRRTRQGKLILTK